VNRLLNPLSANRYTLDEESPQVSLGWTQLDLNPWTAAISLNTPIASIQVSAISCAEQLFQILNGIADLDNDWDGYGALKISDEAIAASRQIIGNAIGLQPFDLTPRANGTLAMEWQKNGREAYVEIGKTRVSGYITKESNQTYFLDLGTSGAQCSLPAIVNALLSKTTETVAPVTQLSYEHAAGADG
jgi:hypothetical protein